MNRIRFAVAQALSVVLGWFPRRAGRWLACAIRRPQLLGYQRDEHLRREMGAPLTPDERCLVNEVAADGARVVAGTLRMQAEKELSERLDRGATTAEKVAIMRWGKAR